MEQYKIISHIGTGGQGSVYKAYTSNPEYNNKPIALKKVQCETLIHLNFALKEGIV